MRSKVVKNLIKLESQFSASNYKPLPIVLKKGKGIYLWDVSNKKYFDFLSAYSAVNQGHCHPKIINKLNNQSKKLTLTSRAFHNNTYPIFAEYATKLFGYDKILPMNSGVEGTETAIKISRKWGYEKKKIPSNCAKIIFASENFWGRSISAISASTNPQSKKNFGPFTPLFENVKFNCLKSLEYKLKNPNVAAFCVEPIQGEAGVILPDNDYLKGVYNLCKKYNVLLIFDEIQVGLGRTGKLLSSYHENVKPDILVLGKALSGGTFPISAVLANNDIMDVLKPGDHGSTYGGNPLASVIAKTALKVIVDEKLSENSLKMGKLFKENLNKIDLPWIKEIRGRGLFNAIEIDNKFHKNGEEICIELMNNGLLTKQTCDNTLRLAPPLVINEKEINQASDIIEKTLRNL